MVITEKMLAAARQQLPWVHMPVGERPALDDGELIKVLTAALAAAEQPAPQSSIHSGC